MDAHEIHQTGDLEYLKVVVAQAEYTQFSVGLTRLGEQTDNQGDACTVHIADIVEVQHNDFCVFLDCFLIRRVQSGFCKTVDLSFEIDDGGIVPRGAQWPLTVRLPLFISLKMEFQFDGMPVVIINQVHLINHVLDQEETPPARGIQTRKLGVQIGLWELI